MSDDYIYDTSITHNWDRSKDQLINTDAEYDVPWGHYIPPLKAFGNLTYTQFIDVVHNLWEKAHPELKFIPYGSRERYDPETGYIVYSLVNKKPADSNLKPRYAEDTMNTDTGKVEGILYRQNFDYLIQFTAIHRDPRTAEEILEAFEELMMITQPVLGAYGVEKFFYNRRLGDRDETRFGEDVAARGVQYMVTLQKLFLASPTILEKIQIDVRVFFEKATPDQYTIMFAEVTDQ